MRVFTLCCFCFLLFWLPVLSQERRNSVLDYKELNETVEKDKRKFEAAKKAFDSLQKVHLDSLKEVMMQKDIEQNIKNLDAFVAGQKEKDAEEEKSLWVRLVLLIIAAGAMLFAARLKKNDSAK